MFDSIEIFYMYFIGLYNLFVLIINGDMKILRNFNKEIFLVGGGREKNLLMFYWFIGNLIRMKFNLNWNNFD